MKTVIWAFILFIVIVGIVSCFAPKHQEPESKEPVVITQPVFEEESAADQETDKPVIIEETELNETVEDNNETVILEPVEPEPIRADAQVTYIKTLGTKVGDEHYMNRFKVDIEAGAYVWIEDLEVQIGNQYWGYNLTYSDFYNCSQVSALIKNAKDFFYGYQEEDKIHLCIGAAQTMGRGHELNLTILHEGNVIHELDHLFPNQLSYQSYVLYEE